jgi:hypothetical protein
MGEKKWGGVRLGAGRPSSDYIERITLEVTPLMKQYIEREVDQRERPRNEVLRYLLGKQLGIEQNMQWNNEREVYAGTTSEGRIVVVDGNTFVEALQQAEKDGMDQQEIYSTSKWEELIGTRDGVWYSNQQKGFMMQGDIDTVVVSADEVHNNIQKIALKEKCWYAISMAEKKRPLIKYIAIYEKALHAITYIAPVRSIEPWPPELPKVVVNFAEPARKIGPIPLVKKSGKAPQGPRYANYERVIHAQTLDDIW